MDCPTVTVVMIAYNMERYIDEAIRGVVRQRVDFPVELLVMDDCSTDSTPQIIERWQRKYPQIVRHVRNERNLGLQRNYMAGFALARGKYMAICDADDYWFCRSKLRRQVAYMEAHPDCDITFHRMVNLYEASGEMSLSNGLHMPADTGLADLSRSNYITNSSVMYRRGQVDLKSLPAWLAEAAAPDYAMHMLYAAAGRGRIHFFSRPMGVYRKVAGSAWSTATPAERFAKAIDVRRRLIAHLAGRPEAVAGLTAAIEAMERALRNPEPQGTPARPPLSRLRAFISRLLPVPKP